MKRSDVAGLLSNYGEKAKDILLLRRAFHKVGMAPGSLVHVGSQKVDQTTFSLTVYDGNSLDRFEPGSLAEIKQQMDPPPNQLARGYGYSRR